MCHWIACIAMLINFFPHVFPPYLALNYIKAPKPWQVPIHLQLGQHPNWWLRITVLSKRPEEAFKGIDINFGCPAKAVNKSNGGASLLKEPELIYQVVKARREAVPAHIPVSAKIRLGWEHPEECFEIVDAIEQAKADELTRHALN